MDLVTGNPTKKRKCQSEEEKPGIDGISSLPSEVALDIISRLPITSLLQFRFVSKACCKLSQDPDLVNQHLSRTATSHDPCLIFHCDYPIQNQIYFVESPDPDDQNGKVRKLDSPFSTSMPEFFVVGSCNGLLCLSDSLFHDSIYVYNPFTRQSKELPKSRQFQEQQVVLGFGFHPVTNEYKVVKIVYYKCSYIFNEPLLAPRIMRIPSISRSEVQIFTLGSSTSTTSSSSKTWRSIGAVPYLIDWRAPAALVNGRLHWTSRLGNHGGIGGRIIVSFDLAEELFREVPRPELTGRRRRTYDVGVLGGCLSAAARCGDGTMEIWVMKEYGVKESWIKEYCLGVYMPKLIDRNLYRSYGIWRNAVCARLVRVLCLLKNGDILMEYKGGNLVSYDPVNGIFKNLMFQGMPSLFQTVVHVGCLNWVDNFS